MTAHLAFRALGCQVQAWVDSAVPEAVEALAALPAMFDAWENALSRFRPHSELNWLNAHPAQWVRVSPTLWEVLQLSMAAARVTGGLVTPTILPALENAGYTRSFERGPAAPARRTPPGRVADWSAVRWRPAHRAVYLPAGVRLDVGGVGKGWAVQMAARWLSRWGSVLVEAGGDIATLGAGPQGAGWPVAVAHPLEQRDVVTLRLRGRAVATSGSDYRRWQWQGQPRHHLIDPHTGQPARTDVLSVSVTAPSVMRAELSAKAMFLLGAEAGLRWLDAQPGTAALLFTTSGAMLVSPRWHEDLWS